MPSKRASGMGESMQQELAMTTKRDSSGAAAKPIPQTKPTGQKRSLERGKSTRKKNPGKRAKQGG
jgi:hypothetical protein